MSILFNKFSNFSLSKCLLLFVLLVTGCEEAILHDLSEDVANRVKVELSHSGVEANKVREASGWAIKVSSSEVNSALKIIKKRRIIKTSNSDPLDSSSTLIKSKEERVHSIERQLSVDIQQTLQVIPGVLEARVHLHSDQNESLLNSQTQRRNSASVLLVVDESYSEEEHAVQRLVSGAAGIALDKVSVIVSADVQATGLENVSEAISHGAALKLEKPSSSNISSVLSLTGSPSREVLLIFFVVLLWSLLKVRKRRLVHQRNTEAKVALQRPAAIKSASLDMESKSSAFFHKVSDVEIAKNGNGIGTGINTFSHHELNSQEVF